MIRILILALIMTPAKASEVTCLTETMYAEARGEPLDELIAVGHNVYNRAQRMKKTICQAAKAGYKQHTIPTNLQAVYRLIANAILSKRIPDLSNGADSFNRGRKPAFKGDIKRTSRSHVHYKMSTL